LRGCGPPDDLIEFLPSPFGGRAIQYFSCIISYSNQDGDFAERLHADLQNNWVRCWFAPEDLKIGDRFRQKIDDAMRFHEKLLLILSEHSVISDSAREEVESALEREHREQRRAFPVQLDNAAEAWAALIRRQRHIGDFRNCKQHDAYKNSFDRLLRDLKTTPDHATS
jgi:hypothetical protein